MKKTNIEAENTRLERELSELKKVNKKLSQKIEKSNDKTADLKKELKKNDARSVTLTKQQEQSLSSLSKDIDILKLLSD